jgi:beta-glucosidase
LADDPGNILGSWGALGRPQDAVTLRAALAERIGAPNVHYAKGAEIVGGSDDEMAEAVRAAEQSDTVILAMGENAGEMTGEASSRAFLGLPGRQQELLEKIAATRKPIVLLIFSGRPLTLPWAFEPVPAVLAAWFPGVQAGPALVRTLFGDANPSGKLVVSWPRSVGQEPLYYNALSTGRPPREGVDPNETKYVSRYIDEQNSPQFPFGYGLSYSSFSYGNPSLDRTQLSARNLNQALHANASARKESLNISAEVTNTGPRAGTETVQCYIRLRGTSVAQPVRALNGFQRIALVPGETKKVSFRLGPEAFAFWNDQQKFAAEPARVTVWLSADSSQGLPATLEITK